MVKTADYIPDRGDLIWLDFSPQSGREQRGRRPAMVLSPEVYNRHGLLLACPITSQQKGYPFEVVVEGAGSIEGVILADHLKNQDWRARNAQFIGKVKSHCLKKVQSLVNTLILQG